MKPSFLDNWNKTLIWDFVPPSLSLSSFYHWWNGNQLKVLGDKSNEAEYARNALFSKHPEMKGNLHIFYVSSGHFSLQSLTVASSFSWFTDWPKDHGFQIFKLDIENIFMINWFGGPKPLTVDQYLHAKVWILQL